MVADVGTWGRTTAPIPTGGWSACQRGFLVAPTGSHHAGRAHETVGTVDEETSEKNLRPNIYEIGALMNTLSYIDKLPTNSWKISSVNTASRVEHIIHMEFTPMHDNAFRNNESAQPRTRLFRLSWWYTMIYKYSFATMVGYGTQPKSQRYLEIRHWCHEHQKRWCAISCT